MFEAYIKKVNVVKDSKPLLINELKDAFSSLKINKISGVNGVSFNINKKMLWGGLRIFNLTISAIS